MKEITYVTGNWAKIDSAKQILEPLGYQVNNIKMDTIEIQADTTEEVAKYSAKWASEKLKCAVLKNDSGLFVEALNGFPGVYTHYVDDTLGEDGLLKLLDGVENRKAYFKEVLAYCEYGQEPITFTAITKGTIAKEKSGTYGWSWDFIFIPEGQTKTLGCYPDKERWKFWSLEAYQHLAAYLDEKEKTLEEKNEICVFVLNDQKQILLQKRSANKKYYPNRWALLTGHVEEKETIEEGALRELQEEVGIQICKEELYPLANGNFTIKRENHHNTHYFYIINNKPSSDFIIQKEELSEVKWYDIDEVIKLIKNNSEEIVYKEDKIYLFEYLKNMSL